ncbi:MAG: HEAT repeat domain-containing protein [bacterium]
MVSRSRAASSDIPPLDKPENIAHSHPMRTISLLLTIGWVSGLACPTADARKRRRRKAPRRKIPPPAPTEPFNTPLPGTITTRHRPPPPPPLRLGTTLSRPGLDAPRPRAHQLQDSDPAYQQAHRAALLAMRGRGGAVRVAVLTASSVGARSEAAARVLARGASVTALRRLTRHKDSQVRLGVAHALAWRPKFGPVLLDPLLRDQSLRVLRAAVRTAAKLGDRRAVGTLASLALRYERSIRGVALQTLARHWTVPVAQRTVIRALTHSSAVVRRDAVVAVGIARTERARYWLGRLARDASPGVRRSVARALARLAPHPSAFQLLGRLQRDRSPTVRADARRAYQSLRKIQRLTRQAKGKRRRRR